MLNRNATGKQNTDNKNNTSFRLSIIRPALKVDRGAGFHILKLPENFILDKRKVLYGILKFTIWYSKIPHYAVELPSSDRWLIPALYHFPLHPWHIIKYTWIIIVKKRQVTKQVLVPGLSLERLDSSCNTAGTFSQVCL